MIARLGLALLIGSGAARSAFALIPAAQVSALAPRHETVIENNQARPVRDSPVVEDCLADACAGG